MSPDPGGRNRSDRAVRPLPLIAAEVRQMAGLHGLEALGPQSVKPLLCDSAAGDLDEPLDLLGIPPQGLVGHQHGDEPSHIRVLRAASSLFTPSRGIPVALHVHGLAAVVSLLNARFVVAPGSALMVDLVAVLMAVPMAALMAVLGAVLGSVLGSILGSVPGSVPGTVLGLVTRLQGALSPGVEGTSLRAGIFITLQDLNHPRARVLSLERPLQASRGLAAFIAEFLETDRVGPERADARSGQETRGVAGGLGAMIDRVLGMVAPVDVDDVVAHLG